MTKYKVVTAKLDDLERVLNEHGREGWKPILWSTNREIVHIELPVTAMVILEKAGS